ncbi:meiotic cell cortex C-terminal pleckstrin homology-domain-containing protein [Gorgonomyces haynaldii]|nr:meiotic cell cortex C-terminal pleckstrin homology-domain-containing protein [Gorgonomyces haynaldii]
MQALYSRISELEQQLSEKEKDIELAATAGQQLLLENEQLKRQLTPRQRQVSITSIGSRSSEKKKEHMDTTLVQEIQQHLLQQSRQMMIDLQNEKLKAQRMQKDYEVLQIQNADLQQEVKTRNIQKEALLEIQWNLEVKISNMQDNIEELESLVKKLQLQSQKSRMYIEKLEQTCDRWQQREMEWENVREEIQSTNTNLRQKLSQLQQRVVSNHSQSESIVERMVLSDPLLAPVPNLESKSVQTEEQYEAERRQLKLQIHELETAIEMSKLNVSHLELENKEIESRWREAQEQIESLTEAQFSQSFHPSDVLDLSVQMERGPYGDYSKPSGLQQMLDLEDPVVDVNFDMPQAESKETLSREETQPEAALEKQPESQSALKTPEKKDMMLTDVSNLFESVNISKIEETNDLSSISDNERDNNLFVESQVELQLTEKILQHRDTIATETAVPVIAPPKTHVECLTYTMLGSWFQKFNRRDKNPHMRFFWINPYTRTILWAAQPPSQQDSGKPKSAKINSIQWTDPPQAPIRNFLPTIENSILITTPRRILRLVPISWADHDYWVDGISTLLQRTHDPQELADVPVAAEPQELEMTPRNSSLNRHKRINTVVGPQESEEKLPLHRRLYTLASREFSSPTLARRKTANSSTFSFKLGSPLRKGQSQQTLE